MFLTLRLMVFFLFFLFFLLLLGGGGGGLLLLLGRGRCLRRGRRRRPKTFPQYSQSILESVCNIQREREREREKVKRFEKQLRRRRPLRTV